MRGDKILNELKKVVAELNLPKTDLQMFRHSCATFLILPPPNGLGYTEERVKDYFGHQDTDMLNKVYARLSVIQKADRMRTTFSEIYKPSDVDERTEEERMKEELLKRISGDNKKQQWFARKCRIHSQIRNALLKGKKEYHYLAKDEKIIELYIKENGNVMKFIKEEE